MYPIKQSTAVTLPFFVHDVAGDAVLSLVDGGFTKRISKGSAAFGAMTVTITEMENGWYSIPLSAAHSDTLGLLTILFTHGSAKQVNLQFRVEARTLDDLAYPTVSGRSVDVAAGGEVGVDLGNVTGTLGNANVGWIDGSNRVDVGLWLGTAVAAPTVAGVPEVDVTHLGGVAQSLLDLKDFADAGYDPITNKVQGVVLVDTTTVNTDMVSAPPTLADIADAVWDEAKVGHVAGGSFGEEVQAHALSSEISALNDLSAADVNGEVDTALADIRLDELLAADSDIDGASPPTVGSVFHELLTKSAAGFTYDQANDSLEALRDRGDAAWVTGTAPSAATIAGAVWDEAKAGHVGAGSFGEEVQAHALSSEITALNDPTAAVIADAVWDEARAAHVGAGSFGEGVVVETNNDKTGYAIAVGGIAATSFAAGAINAAATATDFVNEIWAKICEDQGNYTAQEILSVLLSACAGVTAASTFKTPNGVSDRITATLNASEERTAITLNPSAGA